MADGTPPSVLQVKKYPNRRFYDATRSCHVTLQELYQLVLEGHSVRVTDSRSGDDITNLILVQIMLEKDPPKLHLFPAWVFHTLLRSSHSATHQFVEQMFGPFTHAWARGQRGLDEMMSQFFSGKVASPMDWANNMMRVFASAPMTGANGRVDTSPPDSGPESDEAELETIQSQVAELNRRLAEIKTREGDAPTQA